ncbi:hypothetical protein OG21DRAFT_1505393 [Imleria badia]|nr:hypothetical protein OG21DRAFT_1505393 [Imleria badia]
MERFFLQPPMCALTQLCIRNSYISDRDLRYLTNSSANTLAQVTLDYLVGGLTLRWIPRLPRLDFSKHDLADHFARPSPLS